ncbi:MAG: AMP-binding protein [Candidatus Nanopelagicales bacterium]
MSSRWPRYAGSHDLAEVESVPWQQRGLPGSVYDVVRDAALDRPDGVAQRTLREGAAWESPVPRTHAQLLAEVHRIGNTLTSLGVARRDAVGLLSVNTAELVPAILAAESVAIAAPLNPSLVVDDLAALLHRAGARVLVAAGPELDAGIWQRALELAAQVGLDAVLALRPTGAEGAAPDLGEVPGVVVAHLADLSHLQPDDRLLAGEPAADDLAAFFHTGGTTGTPKLAAHTHRMQVVESWSIALGLPDDEGASVLAALPLFHVNALMVTTLAPLMRARPVVWAGPLGFRDIALLQSFWRIVERWSVGVTSAVPTVYAALSAIPVDADISSLRLVIVGAAPLPLSVAERWLEHTGVPLCEGYGLTEATCASARSFPHEVRAGQVGQRLPYQEIRAVRVQDDGTVVELPAGSVGVIQICGPVVFPGYVVGRDADGPLIDDGGKVVDGWLDTGDLGTVSEDGWLRLVGRAKDLVIRGGHNIDPLAVEQVLLGHDAVLDAGVVGRPDARSGEVPIAFVVVRDGADAETLRRWAAAHVHESAAAPAEVVILPALPVTAVGKPDKVALRVLASRLELGRALGRAGVLAGDPEQWCVARDGVVQVRLQLPDDDQARAAGELLAGYGLDWRVEVAVAAPS